jgi:hypothetical protein
MRKLLSASSAWWPALITLVLIAALRVDVPYYDSWWFIDSYRDWLGGHYGWRELFATHGPHPSVPGKLLYWAVLHLGGGHFGHLAFAAWGFSLATALLIAALLREHLADQRQRSRVMLLCNLLLFSPAMGSTWLWDFVASLYIAGVCLVAALLCFGGGALRARRVGMGCVACIVGALSFGSGFLIAWLSAVIIAWRTRSWKATSAMVALSLTLMWIAMKLLPSLGTGHGTSDTGARVASIAAQPLMACKYVLVVLGGAWGHGSSLDPEWLCMIAGLMQVIVLGYLAWQLWQQRTNQALLTRAMPWLAMCAFGALNAVMITLARMAKSYDTALASRYLVFTLFFGIGLIVLAALLQRGRGIGTLLIGLQVLNWMDGTTAMMQFSLKLRQDRAALSFAKILPLTDDRIMQHRGRNSVSAPAIFLHEQGKLPGVKMISSTALPSAGEMGQRSSHLDGISLRTDGVIEVYGICEWGRTLGLTTDAVLITATSAGAAEQIIAFAAPTVPLNFFTNTLLRHEYADHYHGWRVPLDQAPVPPGAKLRAYALSTDTGKLRRIAGEAAVPPR